MRTLGLIGGTSWESTIEYYRIINEEVAKRLGGWSSAKMLLYSVNFQEFVELMERGEWERIAKKLAEIARTLEAAGAEIILLCTNTMHKVADAIRNAISVRFLDIIDCTAAEIRRCGVKKVAVLGTRTTMEDGFYIEKLAEHGIEAIVPGEEDRREVDRIIFEELCRGIFSEDSKRRLLKIIGKLKEEGCEGVVLACTELPLVIRQEDVDLRIFDTTKIHAVCAVSAALEP